MQAQSVPPGTVIAQRFRVLGVAGSGGIGIVHQALDLRTAKVVALKLLHTGGASELERQRFLREADFLADLHHPHIVGYIDHGHADNGRPYLAMEWLEGEDLAQRLRRQGLTLSESLTLLSKVALALAEAHRRGILHRGSKPAGFSTE